LPPTPDLLLTALETVIDPELDASIVDLGLVYGVEIDGDGAVTVEFTTTAPECPLAEILQHGIVAALSHLPGVTGVEARLVWDPPWNPGMMRPGARERIGGP
jgi:metal-sulfur cluster biosynthetic enzyme